MVALAVLIAAIAVYKSVWLLIFLLLLVLWLTIKGESRFLAIFVLTSGLLTYFFLSINHLTEPSPLPSTFPITWSSDYKINGQKLRGFATTTNGQKLYVVYTFSSEQEKNFYENTSLTGMTYSAKGELVTPSPSAHAYAFSMSNYLTSKGATGVVEITNWHYVGKRTSIFTILAEVRHNMKKHIERTFPKSLVAEAQALLIGVQDQMEDELQRAYQKLGITHLFAISGLHVALMS